MTSRLDDPFWNHNTHYHRDALRLVTPRMRSGLDVGSGEGLLTRRMLTAGLTTAVGIDTDAEQVARARAAAASAAHPLTGAEYVVGDVLSTDLGQTFDLVTCYATVHHMGLRAGLERLAELTAPGGTLVVIGLTRRTDKPADVLCDAVRLPLCTLVDRRRDQWDHGSPVCEPQETHDDVRAAAREITPGATVRRRLLWRYSLIWRKPQVSAAR